MDSLSSARYYEDIRNIRRNIRRNPNWCYKRYRDRIVCMAPESWLALSFFLGVMGISLIFSGFFSASDDARDTVMKFGILVHFSGWAAFIFLIERVQSRDWSLRPLYSPYRRPAFVGVCIEPPIQREFLSDILLPDVNREWVPGDTIPGFKPRHAENVPPPKQQTTNDEENGGEESRSKKKRNKKKKLNNSDLDSPPRESNETSFVQLSTRQEEDLVKDLKAYVLSSIVRGQENGQEYNIPNLDFDQLILRENAQLKESNQGANLNDSGNTNTFLEDKKAEQNLVSDDHRQDSIANELSPEKSCPKSEISATSLDHNVVDSSPQLKKTPERFRTMIKPESDIPKAKNSKDSEKPADQTVSPSKNSGKEVQTEAKQVSPEFITFISKRRIRRRKK